MYINMCINIYIHCMESLFTAVCLTYRYTHTPTNIGNKASMYAETFVSGLSNSKIPGITRMSVILPLWARVDLIDCSANIHTSSFQYIDPNTFASRKQLTLL